MQNVNWSRSVIAEELEDTLKFGGLTDNFGKIRTKVSDSKGKTFYSLPFNAGSVKIYGPKFILINGTVCKSVSEAKRVLQFQYVR
jgi:hypothetical protein